MVIIDADLNKIVIDPSDEKKLKGYQYDSLMYRYIRAREKMADLEYLEDRCNGQKSKDYYNQQARRDIMRFSQILDEVMGEHE